MVKYAVVLIPFPFDDLSSTKVRPAVCLTEPIGPYRHVVLAFITSRIPELLLATDVLVDSEMLAFSATGLRKSSTIQLHRLMTIAADLIVRRLGELTPELQVQVQTRLRIVFDI